MHRTDLARRRPYSLPGLLIIAILASAPMLALAGEDAESLGDVPRAAESMGPTTEDDQTRRNRVILHPSLKTRGDRWKKYQVADEDLSLLSDEELAERVEFINVRLDDGRKHAWYWNRGWGSFYSVGIIYTSVSAGTANKDSKRASQLVALSKAAVGIVRMVLYPLQAQWGADVVRSMPTQTRAQREAQLLTAKKQLAINARRAHSKFSWKAHGIMTGMQIVGGLIIGLGFDDWAKAGESMGVGLLTGELVFYSQPGRALRDVKSYDQFVKGHKAIAVKPRPRLALDAPRGASGALLRIEF